MDPTNKLLMRVQFEGNRETGEERIFGPPFWFDAAIGYWTGEPDLEALRRAAASLLSACSTSWRPYPPRPESDDEGLNVESTLAYLFEGPEDASVIDEEARILLRRCPRQHLHVRAETPHPMDDADDLLTRAGLSQTETCSGY